MNKQEILFTFITGKTEVEQVQPRTIYARTSGIINLLELDETSEIVINKPNGIVLKYKWNN